MSSPSKIFEVHKAGIKIFPKFNMEHRFAVCIEDEAGKLFKNRLTVGKYEYTTKTINGAIEKAIDFCHEKILAAKPEGQGNASL